MPVLGHFFCSADRADSVRQRMQNKVLQRCEHSGKAWGPVGEEQFSSPRGEVPQRRKE